jgi:hypothetical protein
MFFIVHEGAKISNLLFDLLLFFLRNDPLLFDVDPDPIVNTHVNVCNPDKRETTEDITDPILHQQFVVGKKEHQNGYIMTETILTGKQIKELSRE